MIAKIYSVFFFLGFSNAAKILAIFPVEAKSHFFFNKAIMDILVDAGHEVTFISPFPDPNPRTNFTYVYSKAKRRIFDDPMEGAQSMPIMKFVRQLAVAYEENCHDVLETEAVQNLLNSETKVFDLMFFEMLPLFECFLPLAAKLSVPIIATFSMQPWPNINSVFGNPHPFVIPCGGTSSPQKLTPFSRLQNILEDVYMTILAMYYWHFPIKKVYEKYFPTYHLRKDQLSLLFTNYHASIYSVPVAPNVIDISGIHLKPIKPLPQSFKNFLDDSGDGAVLFSFGSITRSNAIDAYLRNIFKETFADLSQRVIWKFEDQIENLSTNVLRADWIPQRDALAHKNVKAFITHCGISGLYEAIDAGVPLIMIPLFGDQISNAALFHELGVGIHLNHKTLTKEVLLNSINEVLHNKKYAKRMQKLSREFWDRPMTPQKSVVYWTEYVLRNNGTGHIKSVIAEIPSYQYLLLDVIAFDLIILVTIIYIIFRSFKFIHKKNS